MRLSNHLKIQFLAKVSLNPLFLMSLKIGSFVGRNKLIIRRTKIQKTKEKLLDIVNYS